MSTPPIPSLLRRVNSNALSSSSQTPPSSNTTQSSTASSIPLPSGSNNRTGSSQGQQHRPRRHILEPSRPYRSISSLLDDYRNNRISSSDFWSSTSPSTHSITPSAASTNRPVLFPSSRTNHARDALNDFENKEDEHTDGEGLASGDTGRPYLNDPPAKRRKLRQDYSRPQDRVGQLGLGIAYCDGGHYEDHRYRLSNVLLGDDSVYCTERYSCNMVLQHETGGAFTIEKLEIHAPASGFTSPVSEGVIAVTDDSDYSGLLERIALHTRATRVQRSELPPPTYTTDPPGQQRHNENLRRGLRFASRYRDAATVGPNGRPVTRRGRVDGDINAPFRAAFGPVAFPFPEPELEEEDDDGRDTLDEFGGFDVVGEALTEFDMLSGIQSPILGEVTEAEDDGEDEEEEKDDDEDSEEDGWPAASGVGPGVMEGEEEGRSRAPFYVSTPAPEPFVGGTPRWGAGVLDPDSDGLAGGDCEDDTEVDEATEWRLPASAATDAEEDARVALQRVREFRERLMRLRRQTADASETTRERDVATTNMVEFDTGAGAKEKFVRFKLKDNKAEVIFNPPRYCKNIVLKFWGTKLDNVDIQAVVGYGFYGQRFFPATQMR